MVGNFLSGAGYNRAVCEDLAEQLQGVGWRVYTTSQRVNRLARLLDMVTTVWRRRKNYQVAQVDVFSGTAFRWAEVVTWMLRFFSKPYVLTLHGGNLPEFATANAQRVQRQLRYAQIVTTPSKYLHEKMQPYYQANIVMQPNPLNINNCTYHQRVKPNACLIWLRAFHRMYNPVLAVQVLAELLQDIPTATLTMIGPDKADGSLVAVEQMAKKLGVGEQLQIIGKVPHHEVPTWLAKSDIFLNTTSIDNTPISVIEAMACGLCVVSTKVGGIPYLLTDEVDALLVQPNDPRQMAEAVQRILNEPGLAARLSATGRKKAESFDWSVVLPQWEKLLSEVMAR
jgi:glycosyltransferase involved in cell wall biosynthesis